MLENGKALSLSASNSTATNMWLPLAVLVLAGAVSADYEHGWEIGKEYNYLVRSRTLTGIDQLSHQYSGILIKALLTVQPKDSQTLRARISKAQYAHVHKTLPGGVDTEISDRMLELRDLPISDKPFEIKSKHGVIRDLIVDREVPTWEVNMLKSIVSQLQVDTQGENARLSKDTQSEGDEPYRMFKAMEDTVGGKCEVLYDITPLAEHVLHSKPELVPIPELKGDGQHIDIIKTKSFEKCDQRMNYHFGITGETKWEPGSNDNGRFLSRSSTSRIVISGDLKRFTIQSSVTTGKMFVSPRVHDHQSGVVASKMNLTLVNVNKVSNPLPSPNNPESTGNLVYIYNNPFSDSNQRKQRQPSLSVNSKEDSVSGGRPISSSEELRRNIQKRLFGIDADASISSSEEVDFWQPKPTLEEAPETPLLPYFVGYRGKAIGKSDKIDLVKATEDLVREIAQDLDDPSSIPDQDTLEKFTILSRLIRTMNRKEIAEVERNVHVSSNELKSMDKSQAKKQNAWAVFRDAVTDAGTGPALLTIKDWIEKQRIEGMEAAEVVSRIPKNARTPTAEYTKAFFEMASNPEVMNEKFLNSAAILAFTELVRQSQISNSTIHNRYPVHAFGRLVSKHDQAVVQEYIPFLARELKKAMTEGDSPKAQTYIMALGNLGHPKILAIFEPYLEGKEPSTTFQRTLMVAAMAKLVGVNPKLARSVFYKIYLNTMEAHQVRCMAVYLLTMTNPPVSMLQRMADFTNYDTNKHVNSAVKSMIENIAELDDPELKDLTKKARAAKHLLNRKDFGYQYSQAYFTNGVMGEQNLAYRLIASYIGSDDSIIPQAWYTELGVSYGEFNIPAFRASGMVSSVRALLDTFSRKRSNSGDDPKKSSAEKIAEALNIQPEDPVKIEGNLMWETKYGSEFLPFDQRSLEKIPELLTKHLKSMRNGGYTNMNKLASYDVTLGFPTETGLPFVYTLKTPTLVKISAMCQAQVGDDFSTNAKSELRLLYSRKIQGRIGFVTPFEHQHFVAGIDMNFQAYAPLKLEVDASLPTNSIQLKVWPKKGEEQARLLHYSVIPYTSNHDILNLRPLLSDKNTHKVHTREPVSKSESIPSTQTKAFRLDVDADDRSAIPAFDVESDDILAKMIFPWSQDNNKYRKIDLFMDLEREQNEPIVLKATFGYMEAEQGADNPQDWSASAKAVKATDQTPDSDSRRKQFLKEAAKGIRLARSRVMDLKIETPGEFKIKNALTIGWADSNAEQKCRALFYWHLDLPNQDMQQEICVAGQSKTTPTNILDFERAMRTKPKQELDIDLRYGRSCSDEGHISIRGKAIQSNELREKIEKSRVAKQCREEMKHGNNALRACLKATAASQVMDEMDLSMDLHSKPVQVIANRAVDMIKDMGPSDVQVDVLSPKNYGKEKIDVKVKLSEKFDKADVSVHTPVMDVIFPNIELGDLVDDQDTMLSATDDMDVKSEGLCEVSCTLDSTQAETFDDKRYPLRLGKCWHAVMTTYEQKNPEKPDEKLRIPQDRRVSIVARETDDGKKEVKVLLGNTEIRLSPESQPEVSVNGEKVRISEDVTRQEKKNNRLIYEIYRLSDKSIRLLSKEYDVDVTYDGKRLLIKASDKYRKSVRGLCGNFDSDSQNDFTGPKNCMLKKPEEFVASYALTKDQCEGESLEKARRAHEFECVRDTKRMSNVISDWEAGKSKAARGGWGYHHRQEQGQDGKRCNTYRTKVEMIDDQVCFTIRPVPSCADECSPTETKTKNYQFHCMPKNNASLGLKKRVEKGANPDLSQKSVSLTRAIQVPFECRA